MTRNHLLSKSRILVSSNASRSIATLKRSLNTFLHSNSVAKISASLSVLLNAILLHLVVCHDVIRFLYEEMHDQAHR